MTSSVSPGLCLANSADDKLIIFFLVFLQKTGFVTSLGMKCQILFYGKNKKKYFNKPSAENFTQSVKHYIQG